VPIRRACSAATVAVGVVLVLSACSDVSADGATKAAEAFTTAQDDPSARCALLAPGTVSALVEDEGSSCEDAIAQLPVGSGNLLSVEVWGEEAQAKLSDDTLFLTHTSGGWRVSAAACQAQGADLPYDCQVEA
jgi:hypothetical protein